MNMDKEELHDRRFATSTDISRLVEQNQGICNTIQALVATSASLDKRVTVLEVRADISKGEAEEIKSNGQETLRVLAEHTRQEDKDRQRLLVAVVSTLLAVLGGVAMLIGQRMAGG